MLYATICFSFFRFALSIFRSFSDVSLFSDADDGSVCSGSEGVAVIAMVVSTSAQGIPETVASSSCLCVSSKSASFCAYSASVLIHDTLG